MHFITANQEGLFGRVSLTYQLKWSQFAASDGNLQPDVDNAAL